MRKAIDTEGARVLQTGIDAWAPGYKKQKDRREQ